MTAEFGLLIGVKLINNDLLLHMWSVAPLSTINLKELQGGEELELVIGGVGG